LSADYSVSAESKNSCFGRTLIAITTCLKVIISQTVQSESSLSKGEVVGPSVVHANEGHLGAGVKAGLGPKVLLHSR
jgi:hypothetical protein